MLTVMTYNLYLGADLTPLLAAPTPEAFDAAFRDVMACLDATDMRKRARLLAQEISAVRPDVIALQEAVIWQTPDGDRRDYLQLLLNALRKMGQEYWPVSTGYGPTITAVTDYPGFGFTNRNIILLRSDYPAGDNDVRYSVQGQFSVNLHVPSPVLGVVPIERGWASIDVYNRGIGFRLITAHLEDSHPGVREAQVAELVRGLSVVTMPVVLVGDFNAEPSSPTYSALIEAGFVDVWTSAEPTDDGATCCQAVDLRNEDSLLRQRIDYIFGRGVRMAQPFVVGNNPARRAADGMWPSDHTGLAATITGFGS